MNLSWFQCDVDLKDHPKMKRARRLPGGDSIVLMWVFMMGLAMKCPRPGILEISEGLPYTDDDLSDEFAIKIDVVRMGLKLFESFRMIRIDEKNTIHLINYKKYQNIDKIEYRREKERIRKAEWREKRLLLLAPSKCPTGRDADETPPSAPREEKSREEKNRGEGEDAPISEKKNAYAIELQLYIRELLIRSKYIYETDTRMHTNVSDIIDNLDVLNKERIDQFFKARKSVKPRFLNQDITEYAADLRRNGKTLSTFAPVQEYTGTVHTPDYSIETQGREMIDRVTKRIKISRGETA